MVDSIYSMFLNRTRQRRFKMIKKMSILFDATLLRKLPLQQLKHLYNDYLAYFPKAPKDSIEIEDFICNCARFGNPGWMTKLVRDQRERLFKLSLTNKRPSPPNQKQRHKSFKKNRGQVM